MSKLDEIMAAKAAQKPAEVQKEVEEKKVEDGDKGEEKKSAFKQYKAYTSRTFRYGRYNEIILKPDAEGIFTPKNAEEAELCKHWAKTHELYEV